MDKFHVSFSVLDPWSHGDYETAINRYLKRPEPSNQQMEEGRIWHEKWRAETIKTGKLPEVFGGKELTFPECELRLYTLIDDWIEFVGVVDNLTTEEIHEYKTGTRNSLAYASSMQPRVYQVLAIDNGYHPKRATIHHYNQYTGKVTTSRIHLTTLSYENAKDWIITYASEMRVALESQGLL